MKRYFITKNRSNLQPYAIADLQGYYHKLRMHIKEIGMKYVAILCKIVRSSFVINNCY